MAPIHPKLVHFPIALLVISCLFFILAILVKSKGKIFLEVFKWNLFTGTIASLIALISGFQDEKSLVHNNEIHALMEVHEKLGVVITLLFVMLSAWLLIRRLLFKKYEAYAFLLVHLMAIGIMIYSAHLGGKMVYEHGAAVAPMEQILNSGHNHEGNHEHDSHDH